MAQQSHRHLRHEYDRQHVNEILSRVRGSGGLPLSEKAKEQFHVWLKTLMKRKFNTPEFLSDPDTVLDTYKSNFPNPMTRGQYVRSFLAYISGLTDEEFAVFYPNFPLPEGRYTLVSTMRRITTEANSERKMMRAGQARPQRGET